MELVPFKREHSAAFLSSAAAEGWITTQAEIDFLLKSSPDCCLVSISESQPIAFITAIRYERSAWIGNLLVLPEYRQRGLGRALMEKALQCLECPGTETVWLTASADGAHLYSSLGFVQIDRVQRWRGSGNRTTGSVPPAEAEALTRLDSMGWGDARGLIFAALEEPSGFFRADDGFLIHTPAADGLQVGPWGAASPMSAASLLDAGIGGDGDSMRIFLDSPEKNPAAGELLSARGFAVCSCTLLMYRGRIPEYRPEYIYSLASMGSYG